MKIVDTLKKVEVHHEYLVTEWYKPHFRQFDSVIKDPNMLNLDNKADIDLMETVLRSHRSPILDRLPKDILWNRAELEENDFENLLVIRESGWVNTFGPNRNLRDVAGQVARSNFEVGGVNIPLIHDIRRAIGSHPFKERIFVISNNDSGPFTVLEGNHRAVAFQLEVNETGSNGHLPKYVILGTSPSMGTSPWLNYP